MASSTVTQITENGQGSARGSLHWAIEQANETTGDITLATGADITIASQSLPLMGSISINNSPLFDGNTYVFDGSAEEESYNSGGSIDITASGLILLDAATITVRPTNEIIETNHHIDSNATIPLIGQAGGSINLTSNLFHSFDTFVVDTLANEEEDNADIGGSLSLTGDPGSFIILNFLIGGKGKDLLIGSGGSDVFYGGAERDRLLGGAGVDALFADNGNDLLYGNGSQDFLDGGRGNDKLLGGSGDDDLDGGRGNDKLLGNTGSDDLDGGKGRDRLFGGAGNDTLSGGTGNDFLVGDAGRDRLEGGQGRDVLLGGSGRDTFVLASSGRLRGSDGGLASPKPVSARDVISDFKAGQDKIEVIGLSFGALSFEGNRISIAETSEVIASLTGIDTTTLSAADFV